jgi:hypothetical protein
MKKSQFVKQLISNPIQTIKCPRLVPKCGALPIGTAHEPVQQEFRPDTDDHTARNSLEPESSHE